ncbi:diguanylate cyclase (GGDEF)-like protein/PAS domain S-box-containing protein [Paenibacillus endophyticus]|uniref:Diguanylate cyclase (GGDEF)-like protein/PAS domain S-box-containing protein n=1 Tax=Paenibacillus endophyticus TaxID=1294268 RepID=A0A7W5GDG1_9BACL|nr:GGDEF domain-containing phosphodiesterase [Paenibacillus endophyticus]MBB3155007.1 diguanylate cyclase (GGDEF)-like protein/PAS domain S-box-containing protein [Paenibacillus endophyticus]
MKRMDGFPNQTKRQQLRQSFNGSFVISCLLTALALVWVAVSLLLISNDMYKWTAAAIAASLFVTAVIVYIKRSESLSFQNYHTAIVETLLRSDAVPLAVLDKKGMFMEMNEASSRTLGYHRSELLGEPIDRIVDPSSRSLLNETFESALQGETKQININITHGSGFPLELQVVCSPMMQEDEVVGTVIISQDLSDRKRNVERIRYMAYYDDMTGLPNRTLFQMKLTETLARAKEEERVVGICYLDLDRFKLVNASFGREFGDILLMQVAERLNRDFSDNDFAARMEGDEFALLYCNLQSEKHLLELSRQLLKAIEEPYELSGFPLHITASIGLVTNQDENDDSYSMIKKADMALVKVKESGKNDCMLYSDSWSNSSLERLTLQHEMYRAIQRCEFVLHYQPQYDLGSGTMVGVEALVRWNHPQRGMIPPGSFIPLAEESGMIVQIGDWVLEEACRQNKAWQEAGLPSIPVSVNLSIRQFVQNDLASKVSDVLTRTGLDPKYLDLEITESMTMDVSHVSRCLLDLTELGVNISVDDFGTGYSSFHYLKNFPIDRLKIDRSFVRDIQQDPNDAEIVAAIIAMAHNLNIQVIAEGVETEGQMEFLRKHKCDEMQGFFWSPPVSSDNIEQMLTPGYV